MLDCAVDTFLTSTQPKYINNLLQAADVRKLDHLRAEEKMIQRERAQEGDEFVDKEKFVTEAYKEQLATIRKAEEEEKAKTGRCHDVFRLLSLTRTVQGWLKTRSRQPQGWPSSTKLCCNSPMRNMPRLWPQSLGHRYF